MNQNEFDLRNEWESVPENGRFRNSHEPHDHFGRGFAGDFTHSEGASSWLDNLRRLWHWDDLAAEIGQESQARIALVGLPGVGKSLLFNRLRGWVISGNEAGRRPATGTNAAVWQLESNVVLESLGLFVLADLPPHSPPTSGQELCLALGDPALIVYLLNGAEGVSPTDYRWVAALRAAGKPLLVAANKMDLVTDTAEITIEAYRRLGMPVIPISAETGENVEHGLLPAMLDTAPRLAVPLGRELLGLRRAAARRVIRQAALFAGLIGMQPVPVLDLPFQAMIQVGVVLRVGAAFGHIPTGGMSREVLGTVMSTLGLRYLTFTLVKFVPLLGWAAAGGLSGLTTLLLGEAAIRYYEAGASIPLAQAWAEAKRLRWPWSRWGTKKWLRAAMTPQQTEMEIIPIRDEAKLTTQPIAER